MVRGISRRKVGALFAEIKICFEKINNLDPLYYPGAPDDEEKYMEFLVKVKDIKMKIQNDVRGRS